MQYLGASKGQMNTQLTNSHNGIQSTLYRVVPGFFYGIAAPASVEVVHALPELAMPFTGPLPLFCLTSNHTGGFI